jgi:CDP-diacylglycerol--glycerol-3-phosphate 3-phosphatidyltransferase
MINERMQEWGRVQAARIARALLWTGLTPNALTVIGLLLNCAVAGVLAGGWLRWGGLLVLAAGLFDLLDGAMARVTGQTTPFGAFFDSTLDRYSEVILYGGLLVYMLSTPDAKAGTLPAHLFFTPDPKAGTLLIYLTICGSILVSYTRARAEALGYKLQVGLLARPERLLILAAGLVAGYVMVSLWLLALFTNVTAIQRIAHLWSSVNRERRTQDRAGQGG